MSLLSPLTTFTTGSYTITRLAAGARVDGLWVNGAPTSYASTPLSVRPVSGAALKTLPEGQSVEDTRTVMCAFDLRNKDTVAIDPNTNGPGAEVFEVFNARRWTVRGVSYTRAMLVRKRLGV